jgi:hypothetical protein
MKRPHEVTLSREEGEALTERLEGDALTAEDRRVLVQVLRVYFGLLFALQEAKFSLKRLRAMLLGDKPTKRTAGSPGGSSAAGGSDGGTHPGVLEAGGNAPQAAAAGHQPSTGGHRPGQGRQGPRHMGEPGAWSAVMRNWLSASAARYVARGVCIGCPQGERSASMATPC